MSRYHFTSVHNHFEEAVFQRVESEAPSYPNLAGHPELLADVACVALNALPPRYIRHDIDFNFYVSDQERAQMVAHVNAAVRAAFDFVGSRAAQRQSA